MPALQQILALDNSTYDSKNSPFLSNPTVAMTNIGQHISLSQEAAITLKKNTIRLSKVVHVIGVVGYICPRLPLTSGVC